MSQNFALGDASAVQFV